MPLVRSLISGLLTATLVLLAAGLAGPAQAAAQAAPATVTIRVEGADATLLGATEVTTRTTPVDKAGTACSGTSAGGALEVATRGAWSGAVTPETGQTVQEIFGERHPVEGNGARWVLAVNSVPTTSSPCALELNPGDTVLLFVSSTVPAPARTCKTNGRDGLCGTPDRTAPAARVTSVKEGQRSSRKNAPRILRGTVATDPAGLADVRLRLTRRIGDTRCSYFSGIEDRFLRADPCGAVGAGRFFSIGDARSWSFELPAKLTRGRYTLDVEVTDTLGNFTTTFARGRDRVVFSVG